MAAWAVSRPGCRMGAAWEDALALAIGRRPLGVGGRPNRPLLGRGVGGLRRAGFCLPASFASAITTARGLSGPTRDAVAVQRGGECSFG
eukprot:15433092-Alexandrium_andersonii.AAC.1